MSLPPSSYQSLTYISRTTTMRMLLYNFYISPPPYQSLSLLSTAQQHCKCCTIPKVFISLPIFFLLSFSLSFFPSPFLSLSRLASYFLYFTQEFSSFLCLFVSLSPPVLPISHLHQPHTNYAILFYNSFCISLSLPISLTLSYQPHNSYANVVVQLLQSGSTTKQRCPNKKKELPKNSK